MSTSSEEITDTGASGNTEDRNLAMLTHLSGILFSFLVPLIVWLIHKDKADKGYLTTEAKEALNFQITILIAFVACWVLMLVLIGFILVPIVWLLNLIFCILAAVAVNGKASGSYRYPLTVRLVK